MKKKWICSVLASAMLLIGIGAVVSVPSKISFAVTAEASASEWTNNYQSTSISGTTYTGTAIPLSADVITLPGKYSAADIKKGFMFQVLPSVINLQAADSVRITFRDSVDSSKAVTAGIDTGDWYGTMRTASIYKASVINRVQAFRWSDGTTTYSISDSVNDMNASARDEFGNSSFGAGTHHGFFSADGTNKTATNALKVVYNGTTLSVNGRNTGGNVTAESILTSGYATVELQFTVKNGGMVNLISVGDTSLANMKEDVPPVVKMQSTYYDESLGAYVFEKGKKYLLSELKNELIVVSDNVDPNPTIEVEVYNEQGAKYEGNEVSFTDGDYFKFIVTDCNGNITEVTTEPFALYSIEVLSKYFVEIADRAVGYGILADLPNGYGYTVALYKSDDTQYQNPLTEEHFYLFTDVGHYKVKFTVYDNDLAVRYYYADLEVTDKVAPSMTFEEEYDENGYSINERVKIVLPTLADNNANGEPTVTVKAYFGETEVVISDGYLTLLEVGSYVVEYTAVDKSGNVSVEKKIVVNTGEDRLSPEMSFTESYKNTYEVNEKIELIMPTVSDNVDTSPMVTVEAVLNGELISVSDNTIKPNQAGTLTIAYFVEDAAGNQTMEIVTIQIVGKSESGGCGSFLTGSPILGSCALIGLAIVLKRKKKGETDGEEKN